MPAGPAAASLASELSESWPSEVYGKIIDVISRRRASVKSKETQE